MVAPRSSGEEKKRLSSRYARVVITTALPIATFRKVPHISRFILASIPVENSSIRITEGFPKENYGQHQKQHVCVFLTYEGDCEREFALIATRKFVCQTISIWSESRGMH